MVSVPARLTGAAERMDEPDLEASELFQALETLARINRCFGGTQIVLRHLPWLCDGLSAPIRLLDVGTGYADIPRAIVRWAHRRGRSVAIVALERHPATAAAAARASTGYPEIRLLRGNALDLPFPPQSFDVVLASQILHHMEAAESVRLLGELWRVARRGVLVHDLRRGRWPYAVTWASLHALSRSRVIRHDGPVSIRRGFTPAELGDLAGAAGWQAPRVMRHAFFRLALLEKKR
jgi:SAM-dependent methyltransferase